MTMPDLLHIEPMTRELDGLERLANDSLGGDPKAAVLASVHRLRARLDSAAEAGLNPDQERCECCRKVVQREDAHFGSDDGIWLCDPCLRGLDCDDCDNCTYHATLQEDGWWRAEYRLSPEDDWIALPQCFSTRIGRAETEGYAWAAREGALKAREKHCGGSGEESDDFHLCFNCGRITPAGEWTYWQPDPDHEHGDAEYRPSGLLPGDDDALAKCPSCGDLHGDGYVGAGYEEGTKDQLEAERKQLLTDDPDYFPAAAQQEGEEDWPDQIIARVKVGDDFFFAVKHYPERDTEMETRRYIPAPTQGEEPADFDPLQTEHLEATLKDALDFVQEHHERYSDETGDTLEGDLTDTLHALKNDRHPNQGEGSGETWQATAERATKLGEKAANLAVKRTVERDEARTALERLVEEFEAKADEGEELRMVGYRSVAKRLRQEISSLPPEPEEKTGADLIAAERQRQEEEGPDTERHQLALEATAERLCHAYKVEGFGEAVEREIRTLGEVLEEPQEGDGR